MKESPSAVGALTKFAVTSALSKAGFRVYLPVFPTDSRVDVVYESADGELRKMHCKTGHIEDGAVAFWACSNTGGARKTYAEDVDDIGVYCAENDSVYIVPTVDIATRSARLRLVPPQNNQTHAVRWAETYFLGKP